METGIDVRLEAIRLAGAMDISSTEEKLVSLAQTILTFLEGPLSSERLTDQRVKDGVQAFKAWQQTDQDEQALIRIIFRAVTK